MRTSRNLRRQARPLLTPEQWRDVGGVLLIGFSALCLASLIVRGAPLLDGLRAVVLEALGYGWPLVLGAAIAAGVLMVWPAPPAPATGPRLELDDEVGKDGQAQSTAPRRLQLRPPSWPEAAAAAVGMLAVLGIVDEARTQAGGGVGRFGHWLVSPAGSAGGLLILLLFLLLASIVALRLSPGRAGLAVVSAGRAAYAGRGRIRRLPGRAVGLISNRLGELVAASRPAPRASSPAEAGSAAPATSAGGDSAGIALAVAEDGEHEPAHGDIEPGAELEDGGEGEAEADVARPRTDWTLPSVELLVPQEAVAGQAQADTRRVAQLITRTLASFGVEARVTGVSSGPAVTRYALLPAAGVQVRRVVALQNDLALALGGVALRIEAPIPGQSAIGIEVPNQAAAVVGIREVVESAGFRRGHLLAVALGKDIGGRPVVGDLTRMPHLLIAGATGQGKSVCISALVCSLLLQLDPEQLRLLMIDPKRVELQAYCGLPHLAVPVIVEPAQAAAALRWAVGEMERRYKVLAAAGVRNIAAFNARAAAAGESPLSYLVIVIDELADLMMVAAGEIEELVCRIAQLARAVGIHLVIATQRPSTDIITGLIKANVPSRIAFAVGSQVDSRVILDGVGAEKLLGRGDMLYLPVDAGKPVRLQGAFISDREVEALVGFWRAQGEPRHLDGVLDPAPVAQAAEEREERRLDPLFARAARAVAADGAASVSLLQRKLNVGYSRAGRLVDQLAEHRVIGGYQGSRSREVLMTLPDVDELLERLEVEG